MAVPTQWNTAKPALVNQISSDIPDIEENFEEIQRILEAITTGTLGITDSDLYEVDKLAAGVGFAATTVMLFGQSAAPTSWTKKVNWQDQSMLVYTTGNIAQGGAVNARAAHTHTGPSHVHTGPSHVHTGPSHTHGVGTFAGPSHTHTTGDHILATNEMPAHSHTLNITTCTGDKYSGVDVGVEANAGNTGTTGGDAKHNHGVTGAGGTGAITGSSAAGGTAATGASGTGNTGAGGTGATAGNTAPYYSSVIAATKD